MPNCTISENNYYQNSGSSTSADGSIGWGTIFSFVGNVVQMIVIAGLVYKVSTKKTYQTASASSFEEDNTCSFFGCTRKIRYVNQVEKAGNESQTVEVSVGPRHSVAHGNHDVKPSGVPPILRHSFVDVGSDEVRGVEEFRKLEAASGVELHSRGKTPVASSEHHTPSIPKITPLSPSASKTPGRLSVLNSEHEANLTGVHDDENLDHESTSVDLHESTGASKSEVARLPAISDHTTLYIKVPQEEHHEEATASHTDKVRRYSVLEGAGALIKSAAMPLAQVASHTIEGTPFGATGGTILISFANLASRAGRKAESEVHTGVAEVSEVGHGLTGEAEHVLDV